MEDLGWRLWLWIGGGLGAVIWLVAEVYNRRILESLRQAAELLSLDTPRPGLMDGMLGDHRVMVTTVKRGGRSGFIFSGTWSRIVVEVPGVISRRVRLRWRPPGRRASVDAVKTGDPMFDAMVELNGDEAELLATFDASTRRSVLDLFVGAPFELSNGRISLLRDGLCLSPPLMEIAVRRLVELGTSLDVPAAGLACRLRDSALGDPEVGVQRRARSVLLERFLTTDAAREVALGALEDEDPIVRLHGAMAFGAERMEQVENFARADGLPVEVRLRALQHMVDFANPDRVMPLASALFHHPDPQVLLALARVAWRIEHEAIPALLGRLLVDSAQHPELRAATIRALAECGTVEQVEPLLLIVEARALAVDVKKAARTAIARIQGRLTGARAGQLSVSPGGLQAGALAVARGADTEP